jgi:hypothetical protein
MKRQARIGRWSGVVAGVLLVLGTACAGTGGVWADERPSRQQPASVRLDSILPGYRLGGSLGFRLIDTAIDEQLYRRGEPGAQDLVWSARFDSRWPLTEDQLDRWSAQVSGLLLDGVGADVRLAGWERLALPDVGDLRVAYRYTLATPAGERVGEATTVAFARGTQVGLTGVATTSGQPPVDAATVARLLDTTAAGTPLAARLQ